MGGNDATSNRGTNARGTLRRGTAPQSTAVRKPDLSSVVLVEAYHGVWRLQFKDWVFRHEIEKYLFNSGTTPKGFTLEPTRANDGELAMQWTMRWTGNLTDQYAVFTPNAMKLVPIAVLGGQKTEAEAAQDEISARAEREVQIAIRREHNSMFVPALGMTGGDAVAKLTPGAYIAAPGFLVGLRPLAHGEPWNPDVSWLKPYEQKGWFVWVGEDQGEKTLEMTKISTNEDFQRDICWWLRGGDSLYDAEKKFVANTQMIYRAFVTAFALALTAAPGTGGRADLDEAAVSASSRGLQRTVDEEEGVTASLPDMKSASALGKIDPLEAISTAIAGYQTISMARDMAEQYRASRDQEQVELQATGHEIVRNLQGQIANLSPRNFSKALSTGQLGEAIVKKTLELRGYAVVELQNESGQGIDLVAVKVKGGGQGVIAYVEVKSSIKEYPGRMSAVQKDAHAFVRDRLQRVVDHQGLYRNVDPKVVDIARKLIAEIDNGRPIGGIRADVQKLSNSLSFELTFEHWDPPVPRARVIAPDERAGSVVETPEGAAR